MVTLVRGSIWGIHSLTLMISCPFSTWIHHWKLLPRSKMAKQRFTRIVRSNLSFLLCRSAPKCFNRITSDGEYTNADAETSKTKRTKFSDRFFKSGRSVACVMKVFHVVFSLNHLSRREVGHHLPSTSLIYF